MPMIDMVLGKSVHSLNPLPSTLSISSHCVDVESENLSFEREGMKGFLTSTEGQQVVIHFGSLLMLILP